METSALACWCAVCECYNSQEIDRLNAENKKLREQRDFCLAEIARLRDMLYPEPHIDSQRDFVAHLEMVAWAHSGDVSWLNGQRPFRQIVQAILQELFVEACANFKYPDADL
jgi:hypothetical protein